MLKIFTDTPVQDRRCKVFPKFPSFLSLFYSTDKTDFPLVPAVFSGLSEHISGRHLHRSALRAAYPSAPTSGKIFCGSDIVQEHCRNIYMFRYFCRHIAAAVPHKAKALYRLNLPGSETADFLPFQ